MDIRQRYTITTDKIDNGPGYWGYLQVHIWHTADDGTKTEIGSYVRNYHLFYETFVPFTIAGQDYALYSRHYTATRLMRLPECIDIGGEAASASGFCPVGYFVPYDEDTNLFYPFGVVAGCVWGDDTSWKIQFLDLSKIAQGILQRDERFGYIELCGDASVYEALEDSVDVSEVPDGTYSIAVMHCPRQVARVIVPKIIAE